MRNVITQAQQETRGLRRSVFNTSKSQEQLQVLVLRDPRLRHWVRYHVPTTRAGKPFENPGETSSGFREIQDSFGKLEEIGFRNPDRGLTHPSNQQGAGDEGRAEEAGVEMTKAGEVNQAEGEQKSRLSRWLGKVQEQCQRKDQQ